MSSLRIPVFLLLAIFSFYGCTHLETRSNFMAGQAHLTLPSESLTRAGIYYDYLAAQRYLKDKQVDEATQAYSDAVEKDPRSRETSNWPSN